MTTPTRKPRRQSVAVGKRLVKQSIAWLHRDGYELVRDVERRERWAKERDLFGLFDLVAIGHLTWGIQVTDWSHRNERRAKMLANPALELVMGAGWNCVIHAWDDAHSFTEPREIIDLGAE